MLRIVLMSVIAPLLCAVLGSCGAMMKKPKAQAKPFGETGIPLELRDKPEMTTVIDGEGKLAPEVQVALQEHEQKNLIWTDANDMFKKYDLLDKILAAPKREVWEKTEDQALRTARREGKCVMIWFTDQARNPQAKKQNEELFSKQDFGNWAKDNILRLMVDESALVSTGLKMDGQVVSANHVIAMKKKYKILGAPNIVILSPTGQVLTKLRGYKTGTATTLWGQIKFNVGVGNTQYTAWLKSMEKLGFRVWQDRQNRKVVAKLLHYSKGQLVMIEPDGNRFRTDENKLCADDQAWIAQEKQKRGIE
jgi:thioredoxin-related protein